MSVHQSSAAWKVRGISQTEKLVLVKLADNANDAGWCYPSLNRIAADCCCSRRTAIRAIQRLTERRLIEVRSERSMSNTYRLVIPDSREEVVSESHQCSDRESPVPNRHLVTHSHHSSDRESPPRLRQVVTESHHSSDSLSKGGDRESPKPSRTINEPSGGARKRAASSSLSAPEFSPSDSDEFKAVLTDWWQHKRELGKPYRPTGWATLLRQSRAVPLADLRRNVEHSMANGYQGIFPADKPKREQPPKRRRSDTLNAPGRYGTPSPKPTKPRYS